MARKRYKVGAKFGHAGAGSGYDVYIPIHAIKRAQMMGGLKKNFKYFWYAEEIGPGEWLKTKTEWWKFKETMWAREREKKRKRAG